MLLKHVKKKVVEKFKANIRIVSITIFKAVNLLLKSGPSLSFKNSLDPKFQRQDVKLFRLP